MKKLMIAVAIVCATACANATQGLCLWSLESADTVMSADGSVYNGKMTIDCEALSYSKTFDVAGGSFSFNDMIYSVDYKEYNFTLTAETTTHTYLATTTSTWMCSGVATASFGSGTWTAAPEPTSGLLLLLGMAGLALKRKRA